MRLEDLRTFLRVAQIGNLRRAAEALQSTQSALSKTLARLERETGLPLMERTARGVVLTEAGATLREHAQRMDNAQADLDHALRERRHARAGQVRIGCIPYLVSGLVSPLLAQFFASRPLATFALEPHLTAALVGLLQGGRVDLAVAARPDVLPADLDCLPLGPLPMRVVTRADHPRRALLADARQLAHERWALPSSAQHLRHWLEASLREAGLPPPRLAVESSASPVAFVELLRCTDLLGIMPPRVLTQPAGQGLAALDCPGMAWQHEIVVFWRRDAYLSPMCRDFRDAMVAYCQETGL